VAAVPQVCMLLASAAAPADAPPCCLLLRNHHHLTCTPTVPGYLLLEGVSALAEQGVGALLCALIPGQLLVGGITKAKALPTKATALPMLGCCVCFA
jgi:hypothetical protein